MAHAKGINPSRAGAWYNQDMSKYPLVIRNRVAYFYRGFMAAWLGTLAMATYAALRDGPPQPDKWWPLFLACFWLVGLFGLYWSLDQETSVVRIRSNRSIHIARGKAFRRRELWTDRARFWIEDTKDSEGDPYFKLMMDAPGGTLVVREGHQRRYLEELQRRVETLLERR